MFRVALPLTHVSVQPTYDFARVLELAKIGTRSQFVKGCAVAYVALSIMARALDT